MQKCECQEVAFQEVIDHALDTGEWDFDALREQVGCGQICTACHCDLKCALNEAVIESARCALPVPVSRIPELVVALAIA